MKNFRLRVTSTLATLLVTLSVVFGQTTPQTLENNQICLDPITGANRGPYLNSARTSGICLACSGRGTTAVVDGNLTNFATIDLGVSAAGGYRISVKDSLQYYPAGNEVGFVIRYRKSGLLGLIDATLLNQFSIRIYRSGGLVETAIFSSGSGLLKANGLDGSGQSKQILRFVTTQEFDEVELVYTGGLAVGSTVDVFNAFEGPANCAKSCLNALLTNGESATATSAESGPVAGVSCLLGAISGVPNVIDSDSTTNFATITATAGLLCTRSIQVRSSTLYPPGFEAGFVVDNGGGIIDLNLLGGVTVSTYENGILKESFSGNSLFATSLIGASSRVQLGFKATQSFNSVRISLTGIEVAVTLRVYHAYVTADSDNDGVADCMDRCSTGSDLLDTDGDGTPDACDQNIANLSVTKSVSSARATIGSAVTFTVTTTRTAQFNATGVVVLDTLTAGFTYLSHTVSGGTVYNPTTGRWTIGSALAGPTTSLTLHIVAQVNSEGVSTNVAEVIRGFETDPNSTPNNGNPAEDDIASACVSVPIRLCEGSQIDLSTPGSYTTNVEWFRTVNGVTTSVATTSMFSTSLAGSYSFTATGQTSCASGNCCPVVIVVDPGPTPLIVASLSALCAGTSTALSVSNGVAEITYVWSNGTTGTSLNVSPTATTVYTVSATTAGGCSGVSSFTVVVNPLPVQAPIVALCGGVDSLTYSFGINPTTVGISLSYLITVGSSAQTGPFPYGISRTMNGNTGDLSVIIRDSVTGCSITLPVTAPTNCATCPPKVCVPISAVRRLQ